MERTQILDVKDLAGQSVELYGWVATRRDHGKLIFIDLRDRSGIVQVVFTPSTPGYEGASKLRSEWVVNISGLVKERPKGMTNDLSPTGKVEIWPTNLEVLNESETPPFPLDTDGYEIGEESRMKYRYLDLRRQRMAKNLMIRHKMISFIRNWLGDKGFIEVETPILTKSTPEGARDYVVPSRLYAGKFYALPQSPQQYKQLLMIAGIEKYFQIARCFRDEDTRGDRQPEFTQLDLEMSFVEREDVMALNEKLLIELVQKYYPEKEIQEIPFPRITYKEAMEKYNSDRPDIRKDKDNKNLLAFCWVIDFPFFEKTEDGRWTFTHNPFSATKSPEDYKLIYDYTMEGKKVDLSKVISSQYDVVLNGSEIGGGSIRAHNPLILAQVFQILGYEKSVIQNNFGHMIEALGYGAPPHGGIAWGLDRLVTMLNNEPSIREVIAFPKTGDARDLMMDSPSKLEKKQLKELHIKIEK